MTDPIKSRASERAWLERMAALEDGVSSVAAGVPQPDPGPILISDEEGGAYLYYALFPNTVMRGSVPDLYVKAWLAMRQVVQSGYYVLEGTAELISRPGVQSPCSQTEPHSPHR